MSLRTSIVVLSTAAILVLNGCSLTKKYADVNTAYNGLNVNKFDKLLLSKTSPDFGTLEISKFSAEYSSIDEKKTFKGFIRLKKDSIIMVSIAPLMGIEMFRLKVDIDSVGFIDRYNKLYYLDDIMRFTDQYDLPPDYSVFQSLILGLDPFLMDENFAPRAFKESDAFYIKEYFYTHESQRFGLEYFYNKQLVLKRILLTNFTDNASLEIQYNAFFDQPAYNKIPNEVVLTLVKGNTIDKLKLSYKKAELNKVLNFPFSISDKYTKMYQQ